MSIGRNFKLGIAAATVATILTGCGTTQPKSELAARLETAEKENSTLRSTVDELKASLATRDQRISSMQGQPEGSGALLPPAAKPGACTVAVPDTKPATPLSAMTSAPRPSCSGVSDPGSTVIERSETATRVMVSVRPSPASRSPEALAIVQSIAGLVVSVLEIGGPTVRGAAQTVSEAAGVAGTSYAGDTYLLLGSATGTTPGFTIFGVDVPLNPDLYLSITAGLAGSAVLPTWLGTLDANGKASASYALPVEPTLVGLVLHHAYLVVDGASGLITFASNAVPLTFGV